MPRREIARRIKRREERWIIGGTLTVWALVLGVAAAIWGLG
jgi:hypothetical protein